MHAKRARTLLCWQNRHKVKKNSLYSHACLHRLRGFAWDNGFHSCSSPSHEQGKLTPCCCQGGREQARSGLAGRLWCIYNISLP